MRLHKISLYALLLAAFIFAAGCSRHDDHADHDDHDHAGHDHQTEVKKDDHAEHDHEGEDHDDDDHEHSAKEAAPDDHDDHSGHGHDHGGAGENSKVTYNEKRGLKFDPATAKALGLSTQLATVRPLAHKITINGTVIDAAPTVKVTALVAPGIADDMESHPHEGVRPLAVNRALTHATAQVEITFALTGNHHPKTVAIGDALVVPLTGPAEDVLAVPNAAILRAITGSYAYRYQDGYYLRVQVVLGVTDGAYTEIKEGLAAGDEIAAASVEQLWLTELRLTKGGGHSH